ncbi:MAG: ferritin-like domain-containing protein [Solirubrobacteraceae bacterium]|nr:MAG: hypothetical protein DLM63_08725 [Solirubrobacterales bacterium]
MNPELHLGQIDVDGAVREGAEEAYQDTRLSFLKKAGVGVAGVAGSGAVLGALAAPAAMAAGRPPAKTFGHGDIAILRFALTLEYLEMAFYDQADHNNVGAGDSTGKTTTFLKVVRKDEDAHVRALKTALGSKALKKPKFNFGAAVTDLATFQQTAYTLEKTGVGAYSGQAGNIKSKPILLTALSIVTIEARHTGAIASITGLPIAPSPFDKPLSADKVLDGVKKTKFIVG